ncbi:MAG TPA: SAM-dependent chlorinase/fluorinase [Humisphaera sp.]
MPDSPPPVVTFTTDFGTADYYVAAMKGALLRHCPRATIVDVTHAVPRHDVLFGSIVLERALAAFAPGAIHVAVVDPGVGTDRRIVLARWPTNGQTVICPDNGLLTWAWHRLGPADVRELTWRPAGGHSAVFHGRDIMAPAAGMLASGTPVDALAGAAVDPVLLDVAPARHVRDRVRIIHVDHFGNATTNLPAEAIGGAVVTNVLVRGRSVGPLRRTYHDVAKGNPLALVGSSGLLEIAVCEGSAREALHLAIGDSVELTP